MKTLSTYIGLRPLLAAGQITHVVVTEWIDIELVANQQWLSLFYASLRVAELQETACDCLMEVHFTDCALLIAVWSLIADWVADAL